MTNHRNKSFGTTIASFRSASKMLVLLVVIALVFGGSIIASSAQSEAPDPIRCLHKVNVGDKSYCFFVEKNVVLTPEEIAASEDGKKLTDEELTALILERAGLYMKEPNCNDSSHSVITVEDWTKDKGSFMLSEADLASLRGAAPKNGAPVKLYIDPLVSATPAAEPVKPEAVSAKPAAEAAEPAEGSTEPAAEPEEPAAEPADPAAEPEEPAAEPADPAVEPEEPATEPTEPVVEPEEPPAEPTEPVVEPEEPPAEEITWYPASALTSPSLLFVVVATEKDAKTVEEMCGAVEEPQPAAEQPQTVLPVKKPKIPKVTVPEEDLPEFKTIKMLDRSGGPLEETLKDGDPVTLEWIAPKGDASNKKSSFLDHIPGGAAGLAAIAAAGALAVFVIVKKKKTTEEE